MDTVEEEQEKRKPCVVNARWLIDLDEYNEWMSEEDYFLEEPDVCLTSIICTDIL